MKYSPAANWGRPLPMGWVYWPKYLIQVGWFYPCWFGLFLRWLSGFFWPLQLSTYFAGFYLSLGTDERVNIHSKTGIFSQSLLVWKKRKNFHSFRAWQINRINHTNPKLGCNLGCRSIGINQDQSGSIGPLVFLIDLWLIPIEPRLIWLTHYWSNLFNQYFIYLYHFYFMAMCSTSTCKNKVEALCKFRQQSTEIFYTVRNTSEQFWCIPDTV